MARLWRLAIIGPTLLCAGAACAQSNYRALAERAALQALDNTDIKIVNHGVKAVTVLGSVNAAPKIFGMYERFHEQKHDDYARLVELGDYLDTLVSLPGGDVAILTALKHLHEQYRSDALDPLVSMSGGDLAAVSTAFHRLQDLQSSAPDPYLNSRFYPVLTALGPKAADALPSLLKSFEILGVYNSGSVSPVIAAVGLPSQADVDAVLDTYPKSRVIGSDDPLVVLKGIPDKFRDRAAQRFLSFIRHPEAVPIVQPTVPVGALGVLGLATPEVIAQLEEIAKTDNPLQGAAGLSLAEILAANPAIAPQVSQRKVYPGGEDLPDHLAALAAEKSDYAMKALATLSRVSDDALRLFRSFLDKQHPMENEEARINARSSAITHLIETREKAAALVLGMLPLPAHIPKPFALSPPSPSPVPPPPSPVPPPTAVDPTNFSPDPRPKPNQETTSDPAHLRGLEDSAQARLAKSLREAGPYLSPALPAFLKALAAPHSASDTRMLAWAVLMMKPSKAASARISSALTSVTDAPARASLLTAYLIAGGDPEPVLPLIAAAFDVAPQARERAGADPLPWDEAIDSELKDAILERSDFAWNHSSVGASVITFIISDTHFDPHVLVPFGPLNLDQALLLLEGARNEEGSWTDTPYWTLFLAPDSRELKAALEIATSDAAPRLPSDMAGIRAMMPLLTTDLRNSLPTGWIRYSIAPALAELYKRGTGQWDFSRDGPMLADAADALGRFAAGPVPVVPGEYDSDGKKFGFASVKLRGDAALETEGIRDWLRSKQDIKNANNDVSDLSQKRLKDQQQAEAQKKKLLVIILSLAAALILGSIVVFSARVRRQILILSGRRWALVSTGYCSTIEVTEANAVFRPATGSQAALASFRADLWPPPEGQIQQLKSSFQPGWNIRVLATEEQFRRPWSHLIGSPWSEGKRAIVAGQLCLVAPNGIVHRAPAENISFASFSCAFAPSLPRLLGADEEIDLVERSFRRWGAFVQPATHGASVDDVLKGLTAIDIVHVAAHASGAGIFLQDRFLDLRDIERGGLERLRCRLLVLSACDAGRIEDDYSFVYAMVRSGVNVLAARSSVLDQACVIFFEEFYKALLPSKRAEGIDIGSGIRTAAEVCLERFGRIDVGPLRDQTERQLKETIDSFTLFGDPAAHLRLMVPKHGRETAAKGTA